MCVHGALQSFHDFIKPAKFEIENVFFVLITDSLICVGIVPLFLAARGGHLELVRGLLKNQAAVNFQGGQQHIAPLHWAAHKEREGVALLLIAHGADILLRDKEGRTPLSMAAPTLASKMMSEIYTQSLLIYYYFYSLWGFQSP